MARGQARIDRLRNRYTHAAIDGRAAVGIGSPCERLRLLSAAGAFRCVAPRFRCWLRRLGTKWV
jgi:hypothetical protein